MPVLVTSGKFDNFDLRNKKQQYLLISELLFFFFHFPLLALILLFGFFFGGFPLPLAVNQHGNTQVNPLLKM